jgi:hypothetical protein
MVKTRTIFHGGVLVGLAYVAMHATMSVSPHVSSIRSSTSVTSPPRMRPPGHELAARPAGGNATARIHYLMARKRHAQPTPPHSPAGAEISPGASTVPEPHFSCATSRGPMTITIHPDECPRSAVQLLKLLDSGFLSQGLAFWRVNKWITQVRWLGGERGGPLTFSPGGVNAVILTTHTQPSGNTRAPTPYYTHTYNTHAQTHILTHTRARARTHARPPHMFDGPRLDGLARVGHDSKYAWHKYVTRSCTHHSVR